jgi:acetyltransferase-like isoleucine patch superfamily enzyme
LVAVLRNIEPMNPVHLVHRFGMATASRCRNLYYRALGVNIRKYCWMRHIEIPRNWSDITLEGGSFDRGVTLLASGPPKPDKIKIGEHTYINRNTVLDGFNKLWIGKRVMVGPACYITDSDHTIVQGQDVKSQPMQLGETIIEDGAWLGAGVMVLRNVRIGKLATVGAGAVVTKDVPGGAVVAGVPARVVRMVGERSG